MSMGLAVGAPLVLGEPWVWEMRCTKGHKKSCVTVSNKALNASRRKEDQ